MEKNPGWGAPICVCFLGIIIFMLAVLFLEAIGVHVWHEWTVQNVDDTEVKICQLCGEIKKENPPKHSHIWEVKKEGDEFIAFCPNCGELAD